MTDKKENRPKEDKSGDAKIVEQKPGEISYKELLKEPTRYGDWEHNGRCTDF